MSVLACTCSCSCSTSKKATITVSCPGKLVVVDTFPTKANSTYTLNKDYDLGGRTYILPQGLTIKMKKGVFKNGTLIGQNTKIEGNQPLFDKVTIKGEWNVPLISTSLFINLDYDNSLRDVIALSNPNVNNKVIIEDGTYWVSIEKNDGYGFKLCDNTTFLLKGRIILKPNRFSNYNIIKVEGNNISIEGNGFIFGDRKEHIGTGGEWGMGIEINNSSNVTIRDVTVKSCWGDCIYVGGDSKKITIRGCTLDASRRQGISVTSGEKIIISNCFISNINGTNPQYAVDIEPNEGKKVIDVTIKNVISKNCFGGIQVWGNANDAFVNKIVISNCIVKGTKARYPLRIYKAENIVIDNCEIDTRGEYSALTQYITGLSVTNSTLKASGNKLLNVIQCKSTIIKDNILIKRR